MTFGFNRTYIYATQSPDSLLIVARKCIAYETLGVNMIVKARVVGKDISDQD